MSSPNNNNDDISMISELSYSSQFTQSNTHRRDGERNKRLEERLRDNELYISDLEQKIDELNQKISQVNKHIKIEQSTRAEQDIDYKERIAKLRENVMTLSEKKEISIRAAESEYKRMVREFENRIAELNNEIAELQLQLVQCKQESQDYIDDIKKLTNWNNEIGSKVASEGQSELKQQIQSFENQNTELQQHVQILQEQLVEFTRPPSSSTPSSPGSTHRVLHPFLNQNSENDSFNRRTSSVSATNGGNPLDYPNDLRKQNEQLKRQINQNQIEYIMNEKHTPIASPFQTLHGTSFQPGQSSHQEAIENLEQKIAQLEQQLEYAKQNEEYMSRVISRLKNPSNVLMNRNRSRSNIAASNHGQYHTSAHLLPSQSNNTLIKKHITHLFIWTMYIFSIILFSIISAILFEILGAHYDCWASNGNYIRLGTCPALITDFLMGLKQLIGMR